MQKGLASGLVGCSLLVGVGAAYYVTPAAPAPMDVPPVLVAGTPEQVLAKVRNVGLDNLLQEGGTSKWPPEAARLEVSASPPGQLLTTLWFASDRVLLLRITARPQGADRTELDIGAELPPSRLTRSKALQPFDLKAIAILADLNATEQLGAAVEERRTANAGEVRGEFKRQTGFDDEQVESFARRLRRALTESYRDEMVRSARASQQQGWTLEELRASAEEADLGLDSAAVYAREERERQREEAQREMIANGM